MRRRRRRVDTCQYHRLLKLFHLLRISPRLRISLLCECLEPRNALRLRFRDLVHHKRRNIPLQFHVRYVRHVTLLSLVGTLGNYVPSADNVSADVTFLFRHTWIDDGYDSFDESVAVVAAGRSDYGEIPRSCGPHWFVEEVHQDSGVR